MINNVCLTTYTRDGKYNIEINDQRNKSLIYIYFVLAIVALMLLHNYTKRYIQHAN